MEDFVGVLEFIMRRLAWEHVTKNRPCASLTAGAHVVLYLSVTMLPRFTHVLLWQPCECVPSSQAAWGRWAPAPPQTNLE